MSEGSIKGIVENYDCLNTFLQSKSDIIAGIDPWKQINSSYFIGAAIKTDGTLWTWGCNDCGALGNGTTVDRCSPGTIAGGGTNWCQVCFTPRHTFAIKTDGTLWTWGRNTEGQLGDGTTVNRTSPGTVAGGGTTWCQLSRTSNNGGAAIKTDGTLWTWGNNATGQLGDGTTVSRSSPGTTWGSYTTWCQVSVGSLFLSAIKTDGTLWTWGFNQCGVLGDGTTVSRCSPGTISGGGTNWCSVTNAYVSVLAFKTDGTLWTWGCNQCGVLGDGTTVSRSSPGTIWGSYTTWCQVSGGILNFTAIKTDGTLWTWGRNCCGQLGNGTTVDRCSPGTIAGGGTNWCRTGAVSALKTDGTLWTWGSNGGRLGDGTATERCSPGSIAPSSTPQDFLLISSAIDNISEHRQVSVASSNELPDIKNNNISNGQIIFVENLNLPVVANNECWLGLDGRVLRSDAPTRTLFSWGCNCAGELGDGTTTNRCSPGTIFGGGTTWCQISSGCRNAAAIKTDGTLWTWGYNNSGELANGTIIARCSPGTVAGGGTTWCQVSIGEAENNGAIKTDGTLWTWGSTRSSPGTVAGGGTTWCQIVSDFIFFGAIKTDGTLWTWGANTCGILGDGTTVVRTSPGTVAGGGSTWCQISADVQHAAAIKTDGTLWTWGRNFQGNLGDGTTVDRCSPGTIFGGGTTWCGASLGANSVAIKTDGTIWTWGNNNVGQLGDGTGTNRCSPGTVAGGGTTWCQICSNSSTVTAIKTDGTLWTWGGANGGVLGSGTGILISRSSPGTISGGGTKWCQVSLGFNGKILALQVQ